MSSHGQVLVAQAQHCLVTAKREGQQSLLPSFKHSSSQSEHLTNLSSTKTKPKTYCGQGTTYWLDQLARVSAEATPVKASDVNKTKPSDAKTLDSQTASTTTATAKATAIVMGPPAPRPPPGLRPSILRKDCGDQDMGAPLLQKEPTKDCVLNANETTISATLETTTPSTTTTTPMIYDAATMVNKSQLALKQLQAAQKMVASISAIPSSSIAGYHGIPVIGKINSGDNKDAEMMTVNDLQHFQTQINRHKLVVEHHALLSANPKMRAKPVFLPLKDLLPVWQVFNLSKVRQLVHRFPHLNLIMVAKDWQSLSNIGQLHRLYVEVFCVACWMDHQRSHCLQCPMTIPISQWLVQKQGNECGIQYRSFVVGNSINSKRIPLLTINSSSLSKPIHQEHIQGLSILTALTPEAILSRMQTMPPFTTVLTKNQDMSQVAGNVMGRIPNPGAPLLLKGDGKSLISDAATPAQLSIAWQKTVELCRQNKFVRKQDWVVHVSSIHPQAATVLWARCFPKHLDILHQHNTDYVVLKLETLTF